MRRLSALFLAALGYAVVAALDPSVAAAPALVAFVGSAAVLAREPVSA